MLEDESHVPLQRRLLLLAPIHERLLPYVRASLHLRTRASEMRCCVAIVLAAHC